MLNQLEWKFNENENWPLFYIAQSINVAAVIRQEDMEKLASVVLNGDGEQLAGHTSTKPDIQSFLDNVPAYMVSEGHHPFNCCAIISIATINYALLYFLFSFVANTE